MHSMFVLGLLLQGRCDVCFACIVVSFFSSASNGALGVTCACVCMTESERERETETGRHSLGTVMFYIGFYMSYVSCYWFYMFYCICSKRLPFRLVYEHSRLIGTCRTHTLMSSILLEGSDCGANQLAG